MENKSKDNYDELDIKNDSAFMKLLDKDEEVLLSTIVYKINKRDKRQERTLLITTKGIYNVNRQDLLAKLTALLSSRQSIRRRIDITKLSGVTISETSSEFVIHVLEEYDYRYASANKRNEILLMLCRSFYMNCKNTILYFFWKPDVNLTAYTTTEDDKKVSCIRIPVDDPVEVNEEILKQKFLENKKKRDKIEAQTEVMFHKEDIKKEEEQPKISISDFEILKVLGRGAFGKVMLVEKKDTGQIYALKSLHKENIIDKDQIEHTKTERYVLEQSKSPFLVSLEYAFQTPDKIFMVMQFARGGELFQHLRNAKRFEESRAKFYAAEIVLALDFLHSIKVIYRDLKPENVLLDSEGHVCLTDFGIAKKLPEDGRTYSFVGTPDYLAPEIIEGKGHGIAVDWWALGIITFEMMISIPPFYNREQNTQKMFKDIRTKNISFGSKIPISEDGKDFILKLLNKSEEERMGTNGVEEIKNHKWFADINWEDLSKKKVTPPFKPKLESQYDVDNFDPDFTNEQAYNSVLVNQDFKKLQDHQDDFMDFSYFPVNKNLKE